MIIPYYVTSEGKSLYRRTLSGAYTWLVNMISGFRLRYYNGLAVHLRYNVMRWHPNTRGFGFQADIICMLLEQGFTYKEIPVKTVERRTGGSSALSPGIYFLSLILWSTWCFVASPTGSIGRQSGVTRRSSAVRGPYLSTFRTAPEPRSVVGSPTTTPIDLTLPSAAGRPTRSMLRRKPRRNWRRNKPKIHLSQAAMLFRKTDHLCLTVPRTLSKFFRKAILP